MVRFVVARVLQALVALIAVVSIVFVLVRVSGDPVALMAPPQATAADLERIRQAEGLDRPLVVQYTSYMKRLAQGDLGESSSYRQPVSTILRSAVPETLKLGAAAFVFAFVVGTTAGFVAGTRPGGLLDGAVRGLTLVGQSVPPFFLGILLVLVFAVHLSMLPALGTGGSRSLILPAITLGAYPMAAVARLTRSSVVELAARDQTLFLRAKGVPRGRYVLHTARNAALPVLTLAGVQLGAVLSGTIVVETLFSWPGLGQVAVQAIRSRDFAVVQGVVIVNTAILTLLLFLLDVSYGWLDPRIRGRR